MNQGSHILLNVVIASYRWSETVLAHAMLAIIPDDAITLSDRLFYSADLLLTLNQQGCNRHWQLPAWKNIALVTEESDGPGDRLLKLKVSPQARKKILHYQSSGMPGRWLQLVQVGFHLCDMAGYRVWNGCRSSSDRAYPVTLADGSAEPLTFNLTDTCINNRCLSAQVLVNLIQMLFYTPLIVECDPVHRASVKKQAP